MQLLSIIKRRVKSFYFSILQQYFPKHYADLLYYWKFKKRINWKKPKDLNEKINWLAFNTDTSEWTRLADKFAVREFVKEKGLEHILIPLIGKWDNVEDIDWDKLPKQFVIRTNCGYGDTSIIYDKSSVDFDFIKERLNHALNKRFGIESAERHYTKIKPCIVAEKLICSNNESHYFGQLPLVDY